MSVMMMMMKIQTELSTKGPKFPNLVRAAVVRGNKPSHMKFRKAATTSLLSHVLRLDSDRQRRSEYRKQKCAEKYNK